MRDRVIALWKKPRPVSGPAFLFPEAMPTLDPEIMAGAIEAFELPRAVWQQAVMDLRMRADEALEGPIESVLDRTLELPETHPRDYVSLALYAWPDKTKPEGLPWRVIESIVNVETQGQTNHAALYRLFASTRLLTAAFLILEDTVFLQQAVHRIRTWFWDMETGMNPHLRHSQAIPGRTRGSHWGLIDMRMLPFFWDVVALGWRHECASTEDIQAFTKWLAAYRGWLHAESAFKMEVRSGSNHETYALGQALFLDWVVEGEEAARKWIPTVEKSLFHQIEEDGTMSAALKSPSTLQYTIFNLYGWMSLARHCEALGQPLWQARKKGRGNLQDAARFLGTRFAEWPFREHTPTFEHVPFLLEKAYRIYGEAVFREQARLALRLTKGLRLDRLAFAIK